MSVGTTGITSLRSGIRSSEEVTRSGSGLDGAMFPDLSDGSIRVSLPGGGYSVSPERCKDADGGAADVPSLHATKLSNAAVSRAVNGIRTVFNEPGSFLLQCSRIQAYTTARGVQVMSLYTTIMHR